MNGWSGIRHGGVRITREGNTILTCSTIPLRPPRQNTQIATEFQYKMERWVEKVLKVLYSQVNTDIIIDTHCELKEVWFFLSCLTKTVVYYTNCQLIVYTWPHEITQCTLAFIIGLIDHHLLHYILLIARALGLMSFPGFLLALCIAVERSAAQTAFLCTGFAARTALHKRELDYRNRINGLY